MQITTDIREQIAEGTVTILRKVLTENDLKREDLISLFFTVTPDLSSELPPLAAQEAGWGNVQMLCAAELRSHMMIPRVVRVLAHVHWRNHRRALQHVYLAGTSPDRPDGASLGHAADSLPRAIFRYKTGAAHDLIKQ
ncbi:MAG: hypothetical protein CBARDCOR_5868 [uncultured Caballeronia sp.]|nr:MAG: hypothetical protein CBARDCOR_5868 [uncultured Caballeronia sp.]